MGYRDLIFWISTMIFALIAVYLGASVYFCSGPLKGDLGGCISMAGVDLLKSTTVQIATIAAASGVFYALLSRRRR